jgi:hypothetical protein
MFGTPLTDWIGFGGLILSISLSTYPRKTLRVILEGWGKTGHHPGKRHEDIRVDGTDQEGQDEAEKGMMSVSAESN